MFPVDPLHADQDPRGLFLVQDPDLRSKVLPLFSANTSTPDERLKGEGTTFRVDPWSQCATAFHLIEDLLVLDPTFSKAVLKPTKRLIALELRGLAYGTPPIPSDAWRTFDTINSVIAVDRKPLQLPEVRNIAEVAALKITTAQVNAIKTPYLPVDLQRWRPTLGEKILALGYADLDRAKFGASETRPVSQYLYGSFGKITDIEPADQSRREPWPIIRVEAHWPGGMSGGPVFNQAGNVIGLVSKGVEGQRSATATTFSGWDISRRIFSALDPLNPGFFRCHAIFDEKGAITQYGPDADKIWREAELVRSTNIGMASVNISTGDFIRL